MTEDKNLRRVQALLSRAGHPSTPEEEARTSAAIAAKMIYAHGYVVTVKAEEACKPVEQARQPPSSTASPRSQTASRERVWSFRIITSRFSGWCKSCGGEFEQGEVVAWCKAKGCTHFDCKDYWEK